MYFLSLIQNCFLQCDSLSDMLSKPVAGSDFTHKHTHSSVIHVFLCLQTHQNFTAVTEPTAPVLSGQDEGERLAAKQHRRTGCSIYVISLLTARKRAFLNV